MSFIPWDELDFEAEPEVKQSRKEYQNTNDDGALNPALIIRLEYYLMVIERDRVDLSPTRETWIWLILEFASLGMEALPHFMRASCISSKFDEQENLSEFEKAVDHHKGKRSIGSFFYRCHEAGIPPYQSSKKRKPVTEAIPFPIQEVGSQVTIDLCYEGKQGLAELLCLLIVGYVLFNHTTKRPAYYIDGRWLDDETKQMRYYALRILKQHLARCSSELDNKITGYTKSDSKLSEQDERMVEWLEKQRDQLRETAFRLNQKSQIEAVLELASSILPAQSNDFDANPYLLNVLNGTLDFKKAVFRKHNPQDLLSKQAEVLYDPDAPCPRWEEFLKTIFNKDAELITFVQQCIGYSLTGLTDLQVVLFCYGAGKNGKSVFFSVLKMLLGEYCVGVPIDTLLTSKQPKNSTEYVLATLKGARAAIGSEIPQGRQLNESQVKDLTGGEPIHARKIYESPYSFLPTHKLWMFGNHKPVIRGTDLGIWRRIRLIPFTVTIPEEERREMSEMVEEFGQELSGILNWAIEGYKKYRLLKRLVPPKSVEDATSEYQDESDALIGFLQDRCSVNPSFVCLAKSLYAEYLNWCESENEHPAFRNNRQFMADMKRRGFNTFNGTGNAVTYNGLAIKKPQQQSGSS